jgi:plasmid maintenance system antidote protein VapI
MMMAVKKLLDTVLENQGWTRYRLAKELGISTQAMDHLYHKDAKAMRLAVLIRLQEASGYSVTEFWKLLKEDHGNDLKD